MLRRFELRVSETKGILWVTGNLIMILNIEEGDARELIWKNVPFLWDKAMEDHEITQVRNSKSLSHYKFGNFNKLDHGDSIRLLFF